jgi:CubicO group peptidase (beta-lactamase class C family)
MALNVSEYGQITSVVVSRHGEVVTEEYFEGHVETLRNTRSCTKTVAGMLLGIAIDRGVVAGVDSRLEELLGEPAPPVTLRELLTMSSCLECNDWDESSPGNEELMYPQDDWLRFALGLPLRESKGFSYCTAGIVALGIGLERALGEPLSEFGRRELLAPLGIERAEWVYTPRGETSTAGGLELTSRSLLRLGELYLQGGEGLVPADWVADSIRPHARIDAETEYGYLWWLKEYSGERCFFMTGLGGNRVHVFPERELVAVITSANFGRRDAHALSDRLLTEEILTGGGARVRCRPRGARRHLQ